MSGIAAVPSGTGTPFVAMLSFTVTGTPSSGPFGAPFAQRSVEACGFGARALRIVGVERLDVRLPARDVRFDIGEDLGRRNGFRAITRKQLDGAKVMEFGHRKIVLPGRPSS